MVFAIVNKNIGAVEFASANVSLATLPGSLKGGGDQGTGSVADP